MQKQKLPKTKKNLQIKRTPKTLPQTLPIRHRRHDQNRTPPLQQTPNNQPNQTITKQTTNQHIRNKPPLPSLPHTKQSKPTTKPTTTFKQNQNQQRNNFSHRRSTTRKRKRNPLNTTRSNNFNNTFSQNLSTADKDNIATLLKELKPLTYP
jgi:hypothetical protein